MIQFICPSHIPPRQRVLLFVARDGSEASPDFTNVVLLKLVLHLLPVAVLPIPYQSPQLSLHPFQLLFVSGFEGPPLLLEDSFNFWGNPRFVVGETPYSPGSYGVIHTEIN